MSDVTPDKIELSEQRTYSKVLIAAVATLMLLVQGFFTYLITTASTEIRETSRTLTEVAANVKVQQAQMSYQQKQIDDLLTSKKEAGQVHQTHDARLNSIEQRLALHDQWIQVHNRP